MIITIHLTLSLVMHTLPFTLFICYSSLLTSFNFSLIHFSCTLLTLCHPRPFPSHYRSPLPRKFLLLHQLAILYQILYYNIYPRFNHQLHHFNYNIIIIQLNFIIFSFIFLGSYSFLSDVFLFLLLILPLLGLCLFPYAPSLIAADLGCYWMSRLLVVVPSAAQYCHCIFCSSLCF